MYQTHPYCWPGSSVCHLCPRTGGEPILGQMAGRSWPCDLRVPQTFHKKEIKAEHHCPPSPILVTGIPSQPSFTSRENLSRGHLICLTDTCFGQDLGHGGGKKGKVGKIRATGLGLVFRQDVELSCRYLDSGHFRRMSQTSRDEGCAGNLVCKWWTDPTISDVGAGRSQASQWCF